MDQIISNAITGFTNHTDSTRFMYFAYGLHISSVLSLSELTKHQVQTQADVFIQLGRVECRPESTINFSGCFYTTLDETCLFWSNIGTFLIRDGREIIVEPEPDVDESVLRLFILGPSLGVLLHQRRVLALHASAVVMNGSAIAFMGESGWGKSTTAAAMYARGYDIVADDVTAVNVGSTGNQQVFPGFPRLKIRSETAAWLGYNLASLAVFHPKDERREYRVDDSFSREPLTLKRIYVLAEGTSTAIEPLQRREAFLELTQHSYAVRFLGSAGVSSVHFHQCAQVAQSITIYRLRRPRTLSSLDDVVRAVETHLTAN
jgi:hypothetical protein